MIPYKLFVWLIPGKWQFHSSIVNDLLRLNWISLNYTKRSKTVWLENIFLFLFDSISFHNICNFICSLITLIGQIKHSFLCMVSKLDQKVVKMCQTSGFPYSYIAKSSLKRKRWNCLLLEWIFLCKWWFPFPFIQQSSCIIFSIIYATWWVIPISDRLKEIV